MVSDECYLKVWARKLDVPILSVDYSHAPQAPFPRAIDEVFYAYCWAMKNAELLGSTGENIVFVGDSAGGSFLTACIIKCIEIGIKKPKGLLNIYTVFLTNNAAIPSRFFGWFDVLTSYTLFSRCIAAYNGHEKKIAVTENRKIPKSSVDETVKIPDDHLFSPFLASKEILKEFPPTVVLTANLDFCLDESVEFARKLKKSKVNLKLEVLEGLNHGFLHYTNVFITKIWI